MKSKKLEDIKALVKILTESELSAIDITHYGTKIRLEKNCCLNNNSQILQTVVPAVKVAAINKQTAVTVSDESASVDFNRIQEVKAPMIGVFYRAPSENAQPFVKVGDKVKKGDILCIIEAMKMMNEINSEVDGEIVDIMVNNGEVVEFSQVLFKIC